MKYFPFVIIKWNKFEWHVHNFTALDIFKKSTLKLIALWKILSLTLTTLKRQINHSIKTRIKLSPGNIFQTELSRHIKPYV